MGIIGVNGLTMKKLKQVERTEAWIKLIRGDINGL